MIKFDLRSTIKRNYFITLCPNKILLMDSVKIHKKLTSVDFTI